MHIHYSDALKLTAKHPCNKIDRAACDGCTFSLFRSIATSISTTTRIISAYTSYP